MTPNARPSVRALWATLLFAFLTTGCDDATGPRAREGLEFLVGDWSADVLVVTSTADPGQSIDLLEGGSAFRINVQPSGLYTATLTVLGTPVTEIGTLAVEGTVLTFYREFPSADTATATLTQLSPDRVRLVGSTTFDFEPVGSPDDASLLTELVRQDS
ncbi:MAG TPA: hypothetical protein VLA43_04720 [Longimicrobiales bacterium]|nr:hypothetical protein [Longimicrobiales bacterium]